MDPVLALLEAVRGAHRGPVEHVEPRGRALGGREERHGVPVARRERDNDADLRARRAGKPVWDVGGERPGRARPVSCHRELQRLPLPHPREGVVEVDLEPTERACGDGKVHHVAKGVAVHEHMPRGGAGLIRVPSSHPVQQLAETSRRHPRNEPFGLARIGEGFDRREHRRDVTARERREAVRGRCHRPERTPRPE